MFGLGTLQSALGGIGLIIIAIAAAWMRGKKSGKDAAIAKSNKEDIEHAESIRRRVSVDLSERVRKLDDAGYRD